MRILLISSAFNSMTQRFYVELTDNGYEVAVELYGGNENLLKEAVSQYAPDLIIAPFLTRAIPEEIWCNHVCIIVHPGIEGDRGPSSLDWAIQERWEIWGVTLLQAVAEMDAGPIWASRTFPLRQAPKSSVYRRELIEAAVECLWEVVEKFSAAGFRPKTLDYTAPGVVGKERPGMKQADRRIGWSHQNTDEILARIHAADGVPGVLDELCGMRLFLHNACAEHELKGRPGDIIATASNGAICRATVDGAVWIGHVKPKIDEGGGVKLPATHVVQHVLPAGLPHINTHTMALVDDHPAKEIKCEIIGEIGYLHFGFHNGAMSTSQCRLLLEAYRDLAKRPVKIIVLMGGDDNWSNGIHLNHIEVHDDPAGESWRNINAMDDLVYEVITTTNKLVIAALAANAGAGGAILPLAADIVACRDGVVLNPHYKNMGWLYGSEYWTYLLPKRVGWDCAIELTENCLPVSAKQAKQLGLIDELIESDHASFVDHVREFARSKLNLAGYLSAKKRLRLEADERRRPLSAYRTHELTQMYKNFYFPNSPYHLARSAFVRKQGACWSALSTKARSAIWSVSGHQIQAGVVWPDFEGRQADVAE
jgi:putative two-component system hydrogenase maturation factor HypX/HoxX